MPTLYGSRFFDILLLDALYAQTAVLDLAQQSGWDVVIGLKQNQPDLYKSGIRLFAQRPPDAGYTERREGKTYQVQVWDTEGLPFSSEDPRLIRVVRSEEILIQNHYRQGQRKAEQSSQEWLWITTLDPKAFPAAQVRRLGHDRWKVENNGWNDLTQNWAFKHGFLHACRHRPQIATEEGQRQPVPNRGLAAVLCGPSRSAIPNSFAVTVGVPLRWLANCAARSPSFRPTSAPRTVWPRNRQPSEGFMPRP